MGRKKKFSLTATVEGIAARYRRQANTEPDQECEPVELQGDAHQIQAIEALNKRVEILEGTVADLTTILKKYGCLNTQILEFLNKNGQYLDELANNQLETEIGQIQHNTQMGSSNPKQLSSGFVEESEKATQRNEVPFKNTQGLVASKVECFESNHTNKLEMFNNFASTPETVSKSRNGNETNDYRSLASVLVNSAERRGFGLAADCPPSNGPRQANRQLFTPESGRQSAGRGRMEWATRISEENSDMKESDVLDILDPPSEANRTGERLFSSGRRLHRTVSCKESTPTRRHLPTFIPSTLYDTPVDLRTARNSLARIKNKVVENDILNSTIRESEIIQHFVSDC